MNLIAKVIKKVKEAEDIFSFELASEGSSPLPSFSAGSHIDVEVAEGLVRQYSLCNDPRESSRYMIAVLRDPQSRGGSIGMHDRFKVGDSVKISDPKNHFPLVPAKRSLLFAGGIGVTPLLCMAERLSHIDADFELHYSTRSRERTAFYDRLASSPFAAKVHHYFDADTDGKKLDIKSLLAQPSPDTHIYVCGPGGFIDYVLGAAKSAGWKADQVHHEYFGAALQTTGGDESFEVTVASSGKKYTVPADKTVLHVLLDNGVEVPYACEQGVCGTCVTRVLDGEVDHRDFFLTDDERAKNDQFMPCCSRAKGKLLVLDL